MTSGAKRLELFRWGWRAAFRVAFVPLMLVEIGLVAGYFVAIDYTTARNFESAKTAAMEELVRVAQREARSIHHQLGGVAAITSAFADQVRTALRRAPEPQTASTSSYATSADGRFHTPFNASDVDQGRCSTIITGTATPTASEVAKAQALAAVNPFMASVVKHEALVSQIYFNSYYSLNHICPPFDALTQYPIGVDTTSYNFYYLADAAHNPTRQTVWTDAYVDPAGQGWMASAVSPVYEGDFLEGVVGLDVTLESFASSVLDLAVPWGGYGLLIARDGTILAFPPAAEADLGLQELTQHPPGAAVLKDTFKPSNYNVFKREDLATLGAAIRSGGAASWIDLGGGSLVASTTIESSGWSLAIVVREQNLYASARDLLSQLHTVGWWMIGGILAIHALFLWVLYLRARGLAASITTPLAKMDAMVAAIGDGTFQRERLEHGIIEVQRTFDGLQATGVALDDASQAMALASQSLELQAVHLRIVMDTVPVPVFFADSSGVVSGTNAAFEGIGLTGGAKHVDIRACLGKEAATQFQSTDGGDTREFVWRCGVGDDAREFLARVATLPQHTDTELDSAPGSPVFVGVLVDLTAQEQARIHAEEARDVALATSKLKTEFLASVSHEIRTPMNGVIGMTELLEGTSLDDEQTLYVKTVRDCAVALLIIINDILDFSALEAGRATVTAVDFDPSATTDAVLDILWPRALTKGLTLTSRVDEAVPDWAHGDDGRIRQILLNLVGNAVKFTDAGAVHVRVAVHEGPGDTPMLCFEVEDTGPGVAPQLQDRLFQPFTQLDSSDQRRHGGTGLGLSISKRLAELMGGEIGYRDGEGGAVFWFTVPLQTATARAGLGSTRWPLRAPQVVLLVDGVAKRAANTASYLRAWGADVHAVADLDAALTLARPRGPNFTAAIVDAAVPDALAESLRHALPGVRWAVLGQPRTPARARAQDLTVLSVPIKRRALRDFLDVEKMA